MRIVVKEHRAGPGRDPEGAPLPDESAWEVLERFGLGLQRCPQPDRQIRLALEAVQEGLGADAVYWHPGSGKDHFDRVGITDVSASWCRTFTERVLAGTPGNPGQLVRTFLDPGAKPVVPWPCSAALVRVSKARDSWLAALSFHPRRLFRANDLRLMLLARRLVVGQRRQARASERLQESVFGLLRCLTAALDARDPSTWGHSERVARIAARLGRQMGLPPAALHDVYLAGLLHDVGKIGLRDSVLRKDGPLSEEEQAHVREHAALGDRLLSCLRPLAHLRPGVRHHHERWDGRGYPDALAGHDIPLQARILAVADSCDALLAPRAHRPALSVQRADGVLEAGAGSQWDPEVVRHFLDCRDDLYGLCRHGPGESVLAAVEQALRQGSPLHTDSPDGDE